MPTSGSAPSQPGAAEERELLLATMLDLVGERGYRRATVALICARAGLPRERFFAHFAGKRECFAAAHAAALGPLGEALVAAASRPDLDAALRAVLAELCAFVEARPKVARATLREPHVVGGGALAANEEVWERLSGALAGACRETAGPRHSPPPVAAAFIVGAIEEVVTTCLSSVHPTPDLRAAVPELARLLAAC